MAKSDRFADTPKAFSEPGFPSTILRPIGDLSLLGNSVCRTLGLSKLVVAARNVGTLDSLSALKGVANQNALPKQ
ncbi:hypothetical protein [Planctomycetes bacterium CA13]|uniref:hypothetical protein n=1 Tax=Novipirellula herctigrandis TaxID=2527986 RepID=UPI0011B3E263